MLLARPRFIRKAKNDDMFERATFPHGMRDVLTKTELRPRFCCIYKLMIILAKKSECRSTKFEMVRLAHHPELCRRANSNNEKLNSNHGQSSYHTEIVVGGTGLEPVTSGL